MSEQHHNPRECWCGIDHSRAPRCEKCGGPRPGEFITCSLEECPYATNPRDAAQRYRIMPRHRVKGTASR